MEPSSSQLWSEILAARLRQPPDRIAEQPPDRLDGRYDFVEEIGAGGMGRVLRCRDVRLHRDVALKIPLRDHDERARERLRREAVACAAIDHPGVVPVFDCSEAESGAGMPYFTMRSLSGATLHEQLAAGASRSELVDAFVKVCEAIAAAHTRGIVHLDLKPLNVVLGEFGEVAVVDWGFACRVEELVESGEPVAVGGTAAYMAPEQAGSSRVGAAADVFALGGMLGEILTGRRPYGDAARGDPERRIAALRDQVQRLQELRSDAELAAVAANCLDPDPDRRPASAVELLDRLRAWRREFDARARQAELRLATRRSRRLAGIASCGLVAVVMAWIGWSWWSAHQELRNERWAAQHQHKGREFEDGGRLSAAITEYESALTYKPDAVSILNDLARTHANQGPQGQDAAIPIWRRALSLQPTYVAGHFNLGLALCARKRFVEAVSPLQTAAYFRAWHHPSHRELAYTLYKSGNHRRAERHFRFTTTLAPEHHKAWTNRTASLTLLQDWPRLERATWQALLRAPHHDFLGPRLSDALRNQHGEEAVLTQEQARELLTVEGVAEADVDPWLRAVVLGFHGKHREAAAAWQQALAEIAGITLEDRLLATAAAFRASELADATEADLERALAWLEVGVVRIESLPRSTPDEAHAAWCEAAIWRNDATLRHRLENPGRSPMYPEALGESRRRLDAVIAGSGAWR